ncbi:MAG: RNA polymerase sigma factor, partial [Gemmobacter sp.]
HASRLSDDAETARDVMQAAWEAILRGLPGLRDDALFLPWALRIVTRAAARQVRGRSLRRRLRGAVAGDPLRDAADAGEAGAWAADGAALHAALARLPPPMRAALALFYLEDMTVAGVAVALDVAPGTVKTRLMHGRARLRAILEGEDDGRD